MNTVSGLPRMIKIIRISNVIKVNHIHVPKQIEMITVIKSSKQDDMNMIKIEVIKLLKVIKCTTYLKLSKLSK